MSYSIAGTLEARAPVWDSAFKIIEAPMSHMNKLLNTHGRWLELLYYLPVEGRGWQRDFNQVWYGLKRCRFTDMGSGAADLGRDILKTAGYLYDKKITIIATVGQVFAYPISWTLTPVTIIADIFAGVIQAGLRTCQGASKEEIQSILHKKVIAAPAQQLAYTINNFVVMGPIFRQAAVNLAIALAIGAAVGIGVGLSYGLSLSVAAGAVLPAILSLTLIREIVIDNLARGILLHSLLLGDKLYRDAQGMVGNLPKFLIPDGYNIFIESGAVDQFGDKAFDPEGEYKKFKEQAEEARRNGTRPNGYRPYSSDFRASIEKDLNDIKETATALKELRDWFISNKEPYTLFGFESEDKVNQAALKKSFNKWSLISHPDKCSESSKLEGAILFNMLKVVRDDVEERIIKKQKPQ